MVAKRSALALALALVGASLAVPQQGLAQPQPPAVNAKAATVEDLNTYAFMAAINMCTLSQNKVPFNPSMQSNLQMVVAVISARHGGLVPRQQAPLKPEQLANGSLPGIVLRMDAMCGKTLPADWKKEFDPLLAQVKQVIQSAGQPPKN
jgi:hypothetical protein